MLMYKNGQRLTWAQCVSSQYLVVAIFNAIFFCIKLFRVKLREKTIFFAVTRNFNAVFKCSHMTISCDIKVQNEKL